MSAFLPNVSADELRGIAEAFRCGLLSTQISAAPLVRFVSPIAANDVAFELNKLVAAGMTPVQVALLLDLVADERAMPRLEDLIDLVTTGPESPETANRDTSVVVRQLFAEASESVLVSGYALHHARRIFDALACRMTERPSLAVRLFLDIQRPATETSSPEEIIRRYARRLVSTEWPQASRLPTTYYFPRSLTDNRSHRASLHAKCIVVDRARVFVSSANLTEAAQNKNIEVGVLIQSRTIADRLIHHFDGLVANGELTLLPLGNS